MRGHPAENMWCPKSVLMHRNVEHTNRKFILVNENEIRNFRIELRHKSNSYGQHLSISPLGFRGSVQHFLKYLLNEAETNEIELLSLVKFGNDQTSP